MGLLDAQANPITANCAGENLLHFAWSLSNSEVVAVVSRLKHCSQLFSQEAKGVNIDPSLELYPHPPGTPLERAVAMNNPAAVRVLLDVEKDTLLANGRETRRALLLAFRLHLVDIQQTLINFVKEQEAFWDPALTPLCRTSWEYKGKRRSFLDAVLVGGVSGFGVDVPLKWWRMCQLGEHVAVELNRSIELALSLEESDAGREALLDASKDLVFKERFHDSVALFLEWKARKTAGDAQRASCLRHLTWKPVEAPRTRLRKIYRFTLRCLVASHFRHEDWLQSAHGFYRYRPSRSAIFMKAIRSEFDDLAPWQTIQSANKDAILERCVHT